MKIALEERKMLIAHRKLESMRLLEELFNRVKVNREKTKQNRKIFFNRFNFLLGSNSTRRIK